MDSKETAISPRASATACDRANKKDVTAEEELTALIKELAGPVPEMQRRLQRSAKLLRDSAGQLDVMLREAGIRE